MLGKTEGKRRRGRQDETVRQHHRLNGHEFEQTWGNGEGQRSLVCCSPWGPRVGHDLATEQQQQWRMGGGRPLSVSLTPGAGLLCSSIHGIVQARILEWAEFTSPEDVPWPKGQTHVFCLSCISTVALRHQGKPSAPTGYCSEGTKLLIRTNSAAETNNLGS